MSNWHLRFKNHAMHKQIGESIDMLQSYDSKNLNAEDVLNIARLLKVLCFFRARIEIADPELLTQQFINTFGGEIGKLRNEVETFSKQKNTANLLSAQAHADLALDCLRFVEPSTATDAFIKAVAEASSDFQTKIGQQLDHAKSQVKSVTEGVASTGHKLADQQRRIDENKAVIEQQKQRLDQAIAQFQQQFSQAEAQRAKDHTAAVGRFEKEYGSLAGKQKQDCDKFFVNADNVLAKHVSFFKEKEEEVKRIFNVIGNVAVAGDYKNVADAERRSANLLRAIALLLMGSMIVIAVITFCQSLFHPEVDWRLFGFRLATCIILAFPAVYAAQESSKHRQREKTNRKLHLELAAIDAYLALLPDLQKNELKGKLTEKFFGQPEILEKEDDISKHALLDLLKTVVNNLTKGK